MFLRTTASSLSCVALVILVATSARADDMRVKVEGCPQYSAERIGHLLTLELATVAEGTDWSHAPSVAVFCGFGSVRILLGDHAGERATSREIPSPRPDQPDAERIIALAASELVLAYMPEAAPAPPPTPRAEPEPTAPPSTTPAFSTVLLSGGAVVHNVEAPVGMARAALRGSLGLWRSVLLAAQLSYEYGIAKRSVGNVDLHAFFGEAGVVWRALERGAFRLDTSLLGGGGLVLFEPITTVTSYRPVASQSPTLRVALALSPGWRAGPLALGLDFEGGALLLQPEADAGPDTPILLGGIFLSAAAHAGVAW